MHLIKKVKKKGIWMWTNNDRSNVSFIEKSGLDTNPVSIEKQWKQIER